jgi:phage baseplate assembly protein W
MGEDFIGSGWAFPVKADPVGRIALVSGGQEIEESIRIILGTARGDRPMRPEFGCGIHDYVFAPVNDETIGSVARDVHQSLARWEPRIDVHQVDVRADRSDPCVMLIDISYAIRRTNDPRNLVVPFYILPTGPAAAPQAVGGAA